ncbi:MULTISPECIES: DUF2971 domain-containing protein [Sorangium]|uniref:DUF2971 domain-containing protein n=1 Tax=Sorangium TaxID=39643 RepID=UPI003D9C348C
MNSPTTIYHYTTIAGLIGILGRRELWASDCRFLNDGAELSYARELFFAEVDKFDLPQLEDGGYRVAWRTRESSYVFVACFCEEGDLLSQWRGYGADHGYALGFDVESLRRLGLGDLAPIQYGLPNPAQYFAEELELARHPTAHPGVAGWHATELLLPRLARVKHPGFAEEREWRLMKQASLYEPEPKVLPQFRPSPLGPLAYIVHSFTRECLREVVVGPGSHAATRMAAVTAMLEHQGFSDINVRASIVPLRA